MDAWDQVDLTSDKVWAGGSNEVEGELKFIHSLFLSHPSCVYFRLASVLFHSCHKTNCPKLSTIFMVFCGSGIRNGATGMTFLCYTMSGASTGETRGPGGWNHQQAYSLTWMEIAASGCWDLRWSCWPEHWHGSSPCGCLAGFHEQASQENQVNLIFLLCPTLRSHTVPLLPFSRFKRREHRPHCFIEGMLKKSMRWETFLWSPLKKYDHPWLSSQPGSAHMVVRKGHRSSSHTWYLLLGISER